MSVVLSCVQPSYLAWIPLFKRILSGDVFVYLDDVAPQFLIDVAKQ